MRHKIELIVLAISAAIVVVVLTLSQKGCSSDQIDKKQGKPREDLRPAIHSRVQNSVREYPLGDKPQEPNVEGPFTILDIVVIDPTGIPALNAVVTCKANTEIVFDGNSAPFVASMRTTDSGAVVKIPSRFQHVMIEAEGVQGWWCKLPLLDVRRTADESLPPESQTVFRRAVLILQPDSDPSRVFGDVLVDGVQRAPGGLEVTLIQEIDNPQSLEESLLGGNSSAHIDSVAGTYTAGPVSASPKGLLVASLETIPVFIQIDSPGRVNLNLETGQTVEFLFTDIGSNAPLAFIDIVYRASVQVDTVGSNRIFRTATLHSTTDSRGISRLAVSQAPSVVAVCLAHSPREALMQGSVKDLSCLPQPIPIRVPRQSDYEQVSGITHCHQSPGAIVMALEGQPQKVIDIEENQTQWEARVAPGEYTVWQSLRGERISTLVNLSVVAGQSPGLVELWPLTPDDIKFTVMSVPFEARISITASDPKSVVHLSPPVLVGRDLEQEVPEGFVGRLEVLITATNGTRIHHFGEFPSVSSMDAYGEREVSLALNAVPGVGGKCSLVLCRLDSSVQTRAYVPLDVGLECKVPIGEGQYYFAAMGDANNMICGVEAIQMPTTQLRCIGSIVRTDSRTGATEATVEAIGGLDLRSLVPESLRSFPVSLGELYAPVEAAFAYRGSRSRSIPVDSK